MSQRLRWGANDSGGLASACGRFTIGIWWSKSGGRYRLLTDRQTGHRYVAGSDDSAKGKARDILSGRAERIGLRPLEDDQQ